MMSHFRLTADWHAPRIAFGPASVAAFGGATSRSPMAAPAERVTRLNEEREDRTDKERLKAVELAVGQIEKQFGKGSIMRLGQKGAIQTIDAIPTGAISIDYALGIG